ncbi:amidase [Paenarthrobacter sp. NPDC089675]|uniref:amidase n=1 Tax=Paenarthrobacter sp. NPDC089675 TaxID=3364376 RepID=UPI0037F8B786
MIWTQESVAAVADFHGLSRDGRLQVWLEQLERDRMRSVQLRDAPLPLETAADTLGELPGGSEQKSSGMGNDISTTDDKPRAMEAVESALERAAAHSDLNAFTALLPDRAHRDAAVADRRRGAGENLALAGETFAVKDIIAVAGHAMTAGTKAFRKPPSSSDAPAVARLIEQGATVIGMANLQLLAFGASGAGSLNGPVVNPLARDQIVGGSSGGSAAAVAAGIVDFSLGTDTGGSIRIPSSLCGVVGLKPTFGRISTVGVHPVSPTLDHVGPIGRTVDQVARIFRVLTGETSPALPWRATDLQGTRIGVPRSWLTPLLDQQIASAWESFEGLVKQLGGRVVDVKMPSLEFAALSQGATIAPDAFVSNHDLLRESAAALPDDVRLRLEMGMFRSATDYVRAQQIRRWIAKDMHVALETCDVLAWPTIPVAAPRVGSTTATLGTATVDVASALTALTCPYNLSGFPVITIPWGRDVAGAGIGMQIGAKPMNESTMFVVARTMETSSEGLQ